ncbi:MAG: hypothetical protein AM325_005045 [Candidatus Thorarchaeota archaeon SMTZ1-45]|nr:MAG: hypothetical protein AM325_06810 [Candidatus Thorarchaeota archaeon SMTZ1-45]
MLSSRTIRDTKRRASPFRPVTKTMNPDAADVVKILVVTLFVFIFIVPITTSLAPTIAVSQSENVAIQAQTETLYHYSLPDINIQIAVGEISGHRGFAYVIEEESRLYFVDVIQDVMMDIALPSGVKNSGNYLTGYDVDLDGNTEFFLRNYVNSIYYILMVDIDDATVSEYPMPFIYPAPMGFGIFNGDSYPDLLVQNVNNRDNFLTLDLITNTTLGTFLADYAYFGPVIGRFTSGTQDSIAFSNQMGTVGQRNLTVVEANGTQVYSILLSTSIQDMVKFDYFGGLEEIATIESDGDVVVYWGNIPGEAYTQLVDGLPSTTRYIETGDFSGNPQDDLVVISRTQKKAFFIDGFDFTPIRELEEIYTYSSRQLGVGKMDQDSMDDLATGTTYGGLGIIRGVDGSFANLEYLVDVRLGGHQIISYDIIGNAKEDVVVRIEGDVYIILSDTTPPNLMPIPIDPLHPTIIDDYVTVRVNVIETSTVEHIDIWMRLPGSVSWIQPQEEMYASHREGYYYAFIGNLQPGEYEYYITVQDSYLNLGNLGNFTHPLRFTVSGNFVWKIEKAGTDYVYKRYHQSDIGNTSDGSKVIYTIERPMGVENLVLTKYSSSGGIDDSLNVTIPSGDRFDNFEVYSAMLDGDNILDIIVLDYYYDSVLKDSLFRYHAYHGSTFTLMDEGNVPYPYKSFTHIGVFDDDGDGNEELFLVSETSPESILKMDSDLSWSAVNFPEEIGIRGFSVTSGSPYGYVAVIRGNTRIDIYTTNLVFSHSLDIDMSGYSNTQSVGIETIYNATTGAEQFVAGFNYWNATDPTGRVYVFDSTTTNVNNTPVYELLHQDLTYLYPADAFGDQSDELFLVLSTGELKLAQLGATLSTIWSTSVTGATPLSSIIADFDGDGEEDFLLFTDQDELLTQISFGGEVEWTVEVGEVYNPLLLGDIDLTPGEEIAAYPFAKYTTYSLGAVRNLDSNYLLNAFIEFSSSDIIQGDAFEVNITVANIYGEIVDDATIYMSAHFATPEGPAVNSFGFYYADGWMKYHAITDATWPIGIANLSVTIDNGFYHPYERILVDAITIRSDLHIQVQAPDLVNQGDAMNISVWVNDNLGGPVDDATVEITLEGLNLPAIQTGPFYVVKIPEVQLAAGIHSISAIAFHPHATGIGAGEKAFAVQIITTNLIVSTDFPASVDQDELVTAWFNITDTYGYPVVGASVSLKSGPRSFPLVESPVVGCYIFSHNITLGIGSQIFELNVQRPNIVGPPAMEVSFDVFGELHPNIFYIPRVEGGTDFEVSVFIKDKYGPIFNWTSVQVEINGTRYSTFPSTSVGLAECSLWVTADFLLGENIFLVFINSTYASPWMNDFSIRAFSEASTSSEVFSSMGWIVTQGDQPIIELHFMDWGHRPISGATVTFFVKALSYSLIESDAGIYSAVISTAGWLPGDYEYVVSVDHPDVEEGDPIVGNISVMGDLEFFVSYSRETPTQGQELAILINIIDGYGNPVPGLEVIVELMGLPPVAAYPTDQIGEYVALIPHIPTNMGYGDFTLTVTAIGEYVGESVDSSNTITVAPATPDFSMSTISLSIGAGASFVLSLIGMVIYFKIASSMRVEDKSLEGRKKSIRNMDMLYLLIVLGSGAGLVASYSSYTSGNYGVALILTVALLGCSVLLYGLWLYRDATAAVLVRGSLSKKRMVLGLWHLVFVPVVIFLILLYGVEIDWFKAYVIDQSLTIGTITVPSIMTTIFVAYVSSILVVVVNLYREVSKGLKKIVKMEDAGTPLSIVEDEKTSMVSRFSSSVRIKFLMFLVVVGATTVMSMDFLASWELGVIVLLPVAFLVVIPFISSKIIQLFAKMSRGKIPSAPVDV